MKIFSTVQTKALALKICKALGTELNVARTDTFSDGEKSTQLEDSVRGQRVFIIGATGNDSIMETLLMIDAAKRAAAESIIAVVPYFGYARQDRKEGVRGPIGAKLVADLLTTAGASEIVSIDLHAAQIQGFFNIPFDHIEGHAIFVPELKKLVAGEDNWLVCTPDAGGFLRASKFAEKLNLSMVAINKHRDKPNSIGSMELVGDVKGKNVIIVDDMCDTAGTLCKAAEHLKEQGALKVIAVCTHPILSGEAIKRVNKSEALTQMFVADTIQKGYRYTDVCPKITEVNSGIVLAKIIDTIINKRSIHEVVS